MTTAFSSLSDVVIFLFAGEPLQPLGTAFLVAYPIPERDDLFVPLVVTAKHVLADHAKVVGRFSPQAGAATRMLEYDLPALRASGDYWEHPDDGVDLAVFRSPHLEEAKYEPIPLDFIASRDTFAAEEIGQADRVVFPALLVNFLGSERNYPVLRDGTIALIPEEPVPLEYEVGTRVIRTEQDVILLDATSMLGASGAPVFLWPGPRIKGNAFNVGSTRPLLLGVMHGFYPALPRDLLTVRTGTQRRMFAENSGIAIAFPSWRLREIMESGAIARRIEQMLNASPPPPRPVMPPS